MLASQLAGSRQVAANPDGPLPTAPADNVRPFAVGGDLSLPWRGPCGPFACGTTTLNVHFRLISLATTSDSFVTQRADRINP